MLMNQLPRPQNNTPTYFGKPAIPYTKAQTEAAIRRADYYENAMDRKRMAMMGL
jgi:hypothetical protein